MSLPLFSVSNDVFERFPDYIVGWVFAGVESNQGPHDDVTALLRDAEERARIIFEGKDLKDEPAVAIWRSAFSSLGWSASRYPAAVEALMKRAARGFELPTINSAADLANAAALTYLVPVGCHDLDRSPNLTVRFTALGDSFLPMGVALPEQPDPGEIVYASGQNVRTRRWVWRQSSDGLVTEDSTQIFFPIDGFVSTTLARVEAATNFLAEMLRAQGGTKVASGMVSRDQPAVALFDVRDEEAAPQ